MDTNIILAEIETYDCTGVIFQERAFLFKYSACESKMGVLVKRISTHISSPCMIINF